jgi:hypothetical protein
MLPSTPTGRAKKSSTGGNAVSSAAPARLGRPPRTLSGTSSAAAISRRRRPPSRRPHRREVQARRAHPWRTCRSRRRSPAPRRSRRRRFSPPRLPPPPFPPLPPRSPPPPFRPNSRPEGRPRSRCPYPPTPGSAGPIPRKYFSPAHAGNSRHHPHLHASAPVFLSLPPMSQLTAAPGVRIFAHTSLQRPERTGPAIVMGSVEPIAPVPADFSAACSQILITPQDVNRQAAGRFHHSFRRFGTPYSNAFPARARCCTPRPRGNSASGSAHGDPAFRPFRFPPTPSPV